MRLVRMALMLAVLTAAPADGRAAAVAGTLALEACRLAHPLRVASVAARCGRLTVLEDRTRAGGATIDLAVAIVPALNRRAAGAPLFVLAGGPGQAASDLYASSAAAFARVNRNHDVVMLDQRGTGGSAPLTCHYSADELDRRELAAELPLLRRATQECLAQYGDRVRYYTSSVAVADLEAVRVALGYDRIELYGSSYGTRMAELYMRRYASATRAVVLDGVTYPEQIIGPDTPADGERALQLIVARCQRTSECAAAFPQLARELAELRARFGPATQPLAASDPATGLPLTVEFNRGMLAGALRFLSYNSAQASLLPTLVHQAAAGNLVPLGLQTRMLSREIAAQLASGMQNSVICSEDQPWFAASSAARQAMALTYQGVDQIEALDTICSIWPRGPMDKDLHDSLHSDIPTLLLSGEADPVTPPQDAERAGRGLTHHRHLVLPGEGHGQLATGCMPQVLAAFLDDPVPERLDAACLERQMPAPFFVAPAGPTP